MDRLRFAFEFCGYDFDGIMAATDNKKRVYSDLRAVAWCIYAEELHRNCGQVGRAFGWNYSTVYSGIARACRLRRFDRSFCDLYDSIYSAFSSKL